MFPIRSLWWAGGDQDSQRHIFGSDGTTLSDTLA